VRSKTNEHVLLQDEQERDEYEGFCFMLLYDAMKNTSPMHRRSIDDAVWVQSQWSLWP
jgi:hypothetical protein